MLSVQSVNLMKQPAFGTRDVTGEYVDFEEVKDYPADDFVYSKDDYSNDKTKLEKQLEDINAVIENTSVPKPVRAFGKVVSVGIGAALGFVSMKYGAQGMAKIFKNSAAWVKKLGEKPIFKSISKKLGGIAESAKKFSGGLYDRAMKSKLVQNTSEFFVNLGGKYKETKLASNISKLAESKPVKVVFEGTTKAKDGLSALSKKASEKISALTGEKIEKGVVNLFAVSGGVTGGVTALQEVTKD